MKRCLITGCGGFIGSHLAEHLLELGVIVWGLFHRRPIKGEYHRRLRALQKLQPFDDPVPVGDNTNLRALGWRSTISLDQSLAEIIAYWRAEADR